MLNKLRHKLKAQNRHGIHSPLVYSLVDKALLVHSSLPVKERIREHLAGWQWRELSSNEMPGTQGAPGIEKEALFVPHPHRSDAIWKSIEATEHSILIDCWDFALLLRTPDVKTPPQVFRLQYRP